jgi:hypothetical protein
VRPPSFGQSVFPAGARQQGASQPTLSIATSALTSQELAAAGLVAPTEPWSSWNTSNVEQEEVPNAARYQQNSGYQQRGADQYEREAVPAPRHRDAYYKPEACKRRRDVLLGLVVAVVSTGLLGLIPGLGPVLYASLVSGVLLLSYVGLLAYMGKMASEREQKLRFLSRPLPMPPAAPQVNQWTPETPLVVRRVASR